VLREGTKPRIYHSDRIAPEESAIREFTLPISWERCTSLFFETYNVYL